MCEGVMILDEEVGDGRREIIVVMRSDKLKEISDFLEAIFLRRVK